MYPQQRPTQFASQHGRGIGDRTGERGYARQSTLPQAGRGQARVFTLTPQDAQASDAVVAGTILMYYFIIESYLIVSAIHSFVSFVLLPRWDDNHPNCLYLCL